MTVAGAPGSLGTHPVPTSYPFQGPDSSTLAGVHVPEHDRRRRPFSRALPEWCHAAAGHCRARSPAPGRPPGERGRPGADLCLRDHAVRGHSPRSRLDVRMGGRGGAGAGVDGARRAHRPQRHRCRRRAVRGGGAPGPGAEPVRGSAAGVVRSDHVDAAGRHPGVPADGGAGSPPGDPARGDLAGGRRGVRA